MFQSQNNNNKKKVVLNIKTIYLTLEICGKENRRKYGLTQRIWYMLRAEKMYGKEIYDNTKNTREKKKLR